MGFRARVRTMEGKTGRGGKRWGTGGGRTGGAAGFKAGSGRPHGVRHALPPRESTLVERLVFGCLAAGLGLVTLLNLLDNARMLGVASAPRLPPAATYPVLALLFVAFVVAFALVGAGTLPRGRRARLAAALGCIALAAALAPMAFFHRLPETWQEPDVFHTLAMLPALAVGAGLALAAPTHARRPAWAGAALLALFSILSRIETSLSYGSAFPSQEAYRAWRIVPMVALLAGLAILATTYGAGALRPHPKG